MFRNLASRTKYNILPVFLIVWKLAKQKHVLLSAQAARAAYNLASFQGCMNASKPVRKGFHGLCMRSKQSDSEDAVDKLHLCFCTTELCNRRLPDLDDEGLLCRTKNQELIEVCFEVKSARWWSVSNKNLFMVFKKPTY